MTTEVYAHRGCNHLGQTVFSDRVHELDRAAILASQRAGRCPPCEISQAPRPIAYRAEQRNPLAPTHPSTIRRAG